MRLAQVATPVLLAIPVAVWLLASAVDHGDAPAAAEESGERPPVLATVAAPGPTEATADPRRRVESLPAAIEPAPAAARAPAAGLAPWDSVSAEARAAMTSLDPEDRQVIVSRVLGFRPHTKGLDYLAPSWNPERKPLAAVDLQELHRITAEYDAALRAGAEEVADLVQAAMREQFDRGEFVREPSESTSRAPTPPVDPASLYRRSTTGSYGGWACRFRFESAEHPAVQARLADLADVRRERDETLRGYIAALP